MTSFVDEMDEVLIELLGEFGWAGTLKRPKNNTIDPDTLVAAPQFDDYPVEGAFFDLVGYEATLTKDYVLSKKWMIVRSKNVELKTGDFVVCPHGTFRVDSRTAIGPTSPIYYKTATDRIT